MTKDKSYITKTSISGFYIIERPTHPDERGLFREIFRLDELEREAGIKFNIVQANHARSYPGVTRGLHAENWNKLVYPIRGKVFLAIVDIRPDSPTFTQHETFSIDNNSHKALFIAKGLANSICVDGSEDADYLYLVDAYYDGKDTKAVVWNDPDLGIDWPIKNPVISERDKNSPTLRELFPEKFI